MYYVDGENTLDLDQNHDLVTINQIWYIIFKPQEYKH
jgi:hypothetical protein